MLLYVFNSSFILAHGHLWFSQSGFAYFSLVLFLCIIIFVVVYFSIVSYDWLLLFYKKAIEYNILILNLAALTNSLLVLIVFS